MGTKRSQKRGVELSAKFSEGYMLEYLYKKVIGMGKNVNVDNMLLSFIQGKGGVRKIENGLSILVRISGGIWRLINLGDICSNFYRAMRYLFPRARYLLIVSRRYQFYYYSLY